MNTKDTFADWLRDAHAMETNLIDMLDGQTSRLTGFPGIQERIRSHANDSQYHAARLEECLKALGRNPSVLKDGVASLAGKLSPLGTIFAADQPVKIILINIAVEHFEIACYKSLLAAADACGEPRIAKIIGDILKDEQRMADFLENSIEEVTLNHLRQPATAF